MVAKEVLKNQEIMSNESRQAFSNERLKGPRAQMKDMSVGTPEAMNHAVSAAPYLELSPKYPYNGPMSISGSNSRYIFNQLDHEIGNISIEENMMNEKVQCYSSLVPDRSDSATKDDEGNPRMIAKKTK